MIGKYHNHKRQTHPWHREEEPHNQILTMGVTKTKKVNNNKTAATERTAAQAIGGPNAPHWHQIFALDSAVVEVQ